MVSAGGPCAAPGCYGSAMAADALANTIVGGPYAHKVSYRFRAKHTGYLRSVRIYVIADAAGYARGTGGSLLVSVHNDSNTSAHTPAARLGYYTLTKPLAAPRPARSFPLITFARPIRLIAGRLYHVMFTNVHASPTLNYLSVDALWQKIVHVPAQPAYSDLDSAVLLYTRVTKAWRSRRGFTPIIQFNFTDGWTEGIGYMEAWVGAPQAIGGARSVRQRFTVRGAHKRVGAVAIRVARTSGAGYLRVRLETSTGALIEQGAISAAAIPRTSPLSYHWARYNFKLLHTLVVGRTYHLVLTAPTGTVYQTFPVRKGMHYGFATTTYFRDGYAQFKSGSRWVGWTQWGATNRTDGDLQFYFDLR